MILRTLPNAFSDVLDHYKILRCSGTFQTPCFPVYLNLLSHRSEKLNMESFFSSCSTFNSLLYLRDSKRRATWEQHIREPSLRFTEVQVAFDNQPWRGALANPDTVCDLDICGRFGAFYSHVSKIVILSQSSTNAYSLGIKEQVRHFLQFSARDHSI